MLFEDLLQRGIESAAEELIRIARATEVDCVESPTCDPFALAAEVGQLGLLNVSTHVHLFMSCMSSLSFFACVFAVNKCAPVSQVAMASPLSPVFFRFGWLDLTDDGEFSVQAGFDVHCGLLMKADASFVLRLGS